MSIQALTEAFDADLPQGPKFILVALANYADQEDSCYPSVQRLARNTGMTTRSVQRHLTFLMADGWVHIEARQTGAGRQTSNRYFLTFRAGRGDMVSPSPRQDVTPEGDTVSPPEPSLRSVTTTRNSQTSSVRSTPRRRRTVRRPALRIVSSEFDDGSMEPLGAGGEDSDLPAPGETRQGSRVQRRDRSEANLLSGRGLAMYFARQVRERDIASGVAGRVNISALSGVLTRWKRDDHIPYEEIREIIDHLLDRYARYDNGKEPWRVLAAKRNSIRQDLAKQVRRVEARDHRDDEDYWTRRRRADS